MAGGVIAGPEFFSPEPCVVHAGEDEEVKEGEDVFENWAHIDTDWFMMEFIDLYDYQEKAGLVEVKEGGKDGCLVM